MIELTAELAWNGIKNYYDSNRKKHCKEINFNPNTKESFIKTYVTEYDKIMKSYMDKSVNILDRHKQAAILIHCTIACEVITPSKNIDDDEIFIGVQQIALLLGLSFMKDCLNEILKKNNLKLIKHYTFPVAFSCATNYFDILTRDLYLQSHEDNSVYILFLAHLLFFVEYLTLKENDIDDSALREWNKNSEID